MKPATKGAISQPQPSYCVSWLLRVLRYMLKPGQRVALYSLIRRCRENIRRLYIFSSLLRSLRGHIGILRATRDQPVSLGPAVELAPSGRLVENTLTFAHSQSIQQLLAKYPWVSLADLQIFLLGFDLGFRSPHCDRNSGVSISSGSSVTPKQERENETGGNSMPPQDIQQDATGESDQKTGSIPNSCIS